VTALRASRRKIMVFIFVVLAIVIVMGTLMYLIEGEANGFTSIPSSVYWAIVTLTTVGYGDITPHTPLGQLIASLLMIMATASSPFRPVSFPWSSGMRRKPGTLAFARIAKRWNRIGPPVFAAVAANRSPEP